MTSKDKLIEFLKSANLEYEEKKVGGCSWILTRDSEYYFYSDGSFESMYNN